MLVIGRHWIRSWLLVVLSTGGLGSLGTPLYFGYRLVQLVGVGTLLVCRTGNRGRRLGVPFGSLIG